MRRDVGAFLTSLGGASADRRKEIEMLVLEREALLAELRPKHWKANALHRLLESERAVFEIAGNDRRLMANFRSIFDELMSLVIEMEDSLRQEYPEFDAHRRRDFERRDPADGERSLEDARAELRRRLAEDPLGWSAQTPPPLSDQPQRDAQTAPEDAAMPAQLCGFDAWHDYLQTYERRARAIEGDLRALRRAIDGQRYGAEVPPSEAVRVRTVEQVKRTSGRNFLIARYHRRFR